MCPTDCSPEGSSTVPAAIEIVVRSGAFQNSVEPQLPQNARIAFVVLAGLSIHVSPLSLRSSRCSAGQAVYAPTLPWMRRHSLQWQVRTSRSGLVTR